MIIFNVPLITGNEQKYLNQVLKNQEFTSGKLFSTRCCKWIETLLKSEKVLMTNSCANALEMSAILMNISSGDEVIMPSYTFVSTANAFVLRGAKIVFVDIRPDTMNIDETKIEAAITDKTKVIVAVHYAGVACEMDTILEIAKKYNLNVIEDAAQAIMSRYKGKMLGSLGNIGCYSFHETKNLHCGKGGAIIINDKKFIERAQIISEKGTNRLKFLMNEVDKYTWVDIGSSYLSCELNTSFLYSQLEMSEEVTKKRIALWDLYYQNLKDVLEIELPIIPKECVHNGHIFYIKLKDLDTRTKMIEYLKDNGISAAFHYIPLHSSPFGKLNTFTSGNMYYTETESNRLLRLPLFYQLQFEEVNYITDKVKEFFIKG
ncbi:MAG: dTDP-4-amino-4,6-dideoxygalactose transaminase [Nitrospirae bacterium]|nr:dTDP-4-amino-4,6-dideoxygalactose transaminase [Nitrospirota bacterium]